MDHVNQLKALLMQYVDDVDELVRRRKPGEGILGMGGGPKDHPCHEQLDRQVQALIELAVQQPLSQADAMQLAACLLGSEELGHGEQCAQLMLVAVQRHALPLIPLLTAADANQLLSRYTAHYPLFKRFPAQKAVIQALKKQAK